MICSAVSRLRQCSIFFHRVVERGTKDGDDNNANPSSSYQKMRDLRLRRGLVLGGFLLTGLLAQLGCAQVGPTHWFDQVPFRPVGDIY